MTKEQKMIFCISLVPLIRDYMEDLKDDFPNLCRQSFKKAINDFINEADKLGERVTNQKSYEDMEEVRKQYQEIYLVHMGITKEIEL